MKYSVISTDDHLQETPETWTSRMSKAKWGDKIPQIRHNADGTDNWYIYGVKRPGGVANVNAAMKDRTSVPSGGPPRWSDVPDFSYVPALRVKAMEKDGVDVHTFFGNISGVAGNTFNAPSFGGAELPEEYRIECIRAFNDFQIDEFAEPFPGKFITLAVVPLWDVKAALDEVHRMQKRGVKGLSFAFPQQYKYPHIADPYWDPFWAEAQSSDLSINLHIGSGGSMGVGNDPNPVYPGLGPFLKLANLGNRSVSANTEVMSTILFSKILDRFPHLKTVSSESGIGWVPYLLEMSDHKWQRWNLKSEGLTLKPSEYFHRQCYVNFWFETAGVRMRDLIGVENIMWESDFPHPTSTWPDSQAYIAKVLVEVSPEERRKILVDNAVKVFNLHAD